MDLLTEERDQPDEPQGGGGRWPLLLLLLLPALYFWTAARFQPAGVGETLRHPAFLIATGGLVGIIALLFMVADVVTSGRAEIAAAGLLLAAGIIGGGVLGAVSSNRSEPAVSPAVVGLPVGAIAPWAGEIGALQASWLPCDGRQVARADYP